MTPLRSIVPIVLLLAAGSALADPRIPQVPVAGSALQNLLNAQGQSIDVQTQQQNVQAVQVIFVDRPTLAFGVRRFAGTGSLNLHNPGTPETLMSVFPSSATPGWHTMASYHTSPSFRLVVSIFDALDSFRGSSTYLGITDLLQGIAVGSGATTVYSTDARNPGGEARLLFFRGTGTHSFDVWLAADTDGNGDFADQLFLLEFFAPVPTKPTSWGRVKALYR